MRRRENNAFITLSFVKSEKCLAIKRIGFFVDIKF